MFPDYRERVRRHEAAHFLVAYLLGLPVTGYSLDIGAAHVDVAEADLERRLIEKFLEEEQVNVYAVSVMAGVVGEATKFETVEGQTADLMDLQKVLNRTAGPAGSIWKRGAARPVTPAPAAVGPSRFRLPRAARCGSTRWTATPTR